MINIFLHLWMHARRHFLVFYSKPALSCFPLQIMKQQQLVFHQRCWNNLTVPCPFAPKKMHCKMFFSGENIIWSIVNDKSHKTILFSKMSFIWCLSKIHYSAFRRVMWVRNTTIRSIAATLHIIIVYIASRRAGAVNKQDLRNWCLMIGKKTKTRNGLHWTANK